MKTILDKIIRANKHKTQASLPEIDNSVFNIPDMPLPDLFKQELEKVGGQAFICQTKQQAIETLKNLLASNKWQNAFTFDNKIKSLLKEAQIDFSDQIAELEKIDVGINSCQYLVAWTGSVIVSSDMAGGRQFNIFSPELIIIARQEQLVLTLDEAMEKLARKYKQFPSQISVITGPSKTADIEKTLIYGMHGPKKLVVIIY